MQNIILSRFDIVQYKAICCANKRDAVRFARQDGTPCRLDVFRVFNDAIAGTYRSNRESQRGRWTCFCDSIAPFQDKRRFRYDSLRYWTQGRIYNGAKIIAYSGGAYPGRHDRVRYTESAGAISGIFDIWSPFAGAIAGLLDQYIVTQRDLISGRVDLNNRRFSRASGAFDWSSYLRKLTATARFDLLLSISDFLINRPSIIFDPREIPNLQIILLRQRFSAIRAKRKRYPGCFDVAPPPQTKRVSGRFDAAGWLHDSLRFDRRAFVRPGWRLSARNLETNDLTELGFVDAETKNLSGVYLPDGQYELIVRTSSVYWKDAFDRSVRRFSVSNNASSPDMIPQVEKLRSSVSGGSTVIRWSAESCKDIVFGLWFSKYSPVDTSGAPTTICVAHDGITEYSYTRRQDGPEYLAVAAMRDEQMGRSSQIYLDYSDEPPRRPDDQVIIEI